MNETLFSSAWRDAFGNSFGSLVRDAEWNIRWAEGNRQPFRYDPDLFDPLIIDAAVRNIESYRGRKLEWAPVPATPEDLMSEELLLLTEVYAPAAHPSYQENARASRNRIQAIEACYPGTLARIEAANPGTLVKAGLGRKAAAA